MLTVAIVVAGVGAVLAAAIGVAAALVLPGDPLLRVAVALGAGTTTALVASALALCASPRAYGRFR